MPGGGKGQFVFVSHANADKGKIRFIVEALIAAGLKVWLDNPAAMRFSGREIDEHFYRLSGGQKWRTQIDEAANEATCVLACWSKTSAVAGRNVILDEVAIGRSQKKLVCCRVDDVSIATLPNGFDEEQTLDLFAGVDGVELTLMQRMERAAFLVLDVQRVMAQRYDEMYQERKDEKRDDFVPYLVDRSMQEQKAAKTIRAATDGKLCALYMQGPRNECPDQFRERLRRYTSADCLANGLSWLEVLVEWPLTEPHEFLDAYEANLAGALQIGSVNVRAYLQQPRSAPIAAISGMGLGEWRRDKQRQCMLAWLKYWNGFGSAAKVVPVLSVDLPEADPGWKKLPPGREQGISTQRVAKDVAWVQGQAAASPHEYIPIAPLETLHPVVRNDANRWLARIEPDTASARWKAIDLENERIFVDRAARRRGVSMKQFAERIRPALAPAKT